jgi:hypothetical protein
MSTRATDALDGSLSSQESVGKLTSWNQFGESELVELVCADLRRLAARHMQLERLDHTLQPAYQPHQTNRLTDVLGLDGV